ncbi:unnamed protein product [Rhodiola kirilowii]
MGRLWRRKSVVESVADRSGELRLDFAEPATATGGVKIQEQQIHPKLVSESVDSYFDGADKFWTAYEQDRTYGGHFSGSSIKQLLSEEMSSEHEHKRRSPSVIARLMGYEGLSLQQPTRKHSPNNHVKSQRTNYEDHLLTKNSKLKQQFKDVYEVSEVTKNENRRYQSLRIATSDLSEAEMAFLRQKFIDAKRLAIDEKCQSSKEFSDALDVLESNKELFLKLVQEPDSMLPNHLHDLRTARPSQGIHTVSKDYIDNLSFRTKNSRTELRRESSRNNDNGSPQKHSRDSLICRTERYDHGNSKKWVNRIDDRSTFPTKIVVLKPNFQRVHVSDLDSDVPSSISEFENNIKARSTRSRSAEQRANKHFTDGLQLPRQNAGESRELAKRITQTMRGSLRTGSLDFTVHGLQDYGRDGSSSHESGNDSSSGSDYKSYRKDSYNRNKVSISHLSGSSVNKEAKERLSERWKMTQRFQEVGLSKRSTLGEMLAVPESRKESKIVILSGKGSIKDRRLNNVEEQAWPLGISSRDGWRYGQVRKLSRSSSVPASSNSPGILESTMRRKLSDDDRHMMQRISLEDRTKAKREIPHREEGLKNRRRRSKSERLHSNIVNEKFSVEYHASQTNDIPVRDEIPHEKEIIVSETSALNDGLVIDKMQGALLTPLEEYDHSTSTSQSEILSPKHDLGSQTLSETQYDEVYEAHSKYLSIGPESPSRSKDAEQPNPMSVFGIPSPDDLSSGTECFGSLTADLQGLRMQLQLLKQESAGYADGSISISSSEDGDDESFRVSEKRSLVAVDSLDSSYMVDALKNTGFYDFDPYTFMANWHSPSCPMSPAIFEKLEEKYGEQAIWSRSERQILYDLINSGLVEIFKQFRDPHPWVKQSFCSTVLCNNNQDGEEKLLNWLQIQITQENDGTTAEKTVSEELEWYDSAHYIDLVGSEIENLLTDELIAELVIYMNQL